VGERIVILSIKQETLVCILDMKKHQQKPYIQYIIDHLFKQIAD